MVSLCLSSHHEHLNHSRIFSFFLIKDTKVIPALRALMVPPLQGSRNPKKLRFSGEKVICNFFCFPLAAYM